MKEKVKNILIAIAAGTAALLVVKTILDKLFIPEDYECEE